VQGILAFDGRVGIDDREEKRLPGLVGERGKVGTDVEPGFPDTVAGSAKGREMEASRLEIRLERERRTIVREPIGARTGLV
jgi:hypothetical protein